MAVNVEYTIRETFTNLRRNVLMSLAAILTVAVSLSLVGAALLIRQAVLNATLAWRGGIEFAIYLDPDASEQQSEAIATELSTSPQVKEVTFVSQEEAYEEFQTMMRNSPELVEAVDVEVLPPSYRVVPIDTGDSAAVEALGERFRERPGVFDVVFAKDTADAILKVSRVLQWGIVVVSAVLAVAATFQILTTIQLAIYARRREIEVQKLVGATNWFIRVPFMLEGMIQGIVGAAGAFGVVAVLRNLFVRAVRNNQLFAEFFVSTDALVTTGVLILALGAAIGAAGSGVAVTRFLDV